MKGEEMHPIIFAVTLKYKIAAWAKLAHGNGREMCQCITPDDAWP